MKSPEVEPAGSGEQFFSGVSGLTEAFEDEQDGGSGPARVRKPDWMRLTPQKLQNLRESFERDTQNILQNIRENLENREVPSVRIEFYLKDVQQQLCTEFTDSIAGCGQAQPFCLPHDWETLAQQLKQENREQLQRVQPLVVDSPDWKRIYEEVSGRPVQESFSEYDLTQAPDELQEIAACFYQKDWIDLNLKDKRACLEKYASYLAQVLGLKEIPALVFDSDAKAGQMGTADMRLAVLHVNQKILYDPELVIDTIAHEMWHIHQRERMQSPETLRDYAYIYNEQPENYLRAEEDFDQYGSQLVEKEARAFAEACRDVLREAYIDGLGKKLDR